MRLAHPLTTFVEAHPLVRALRRTCLERDEIILQSETRRSSGEHLEQVMPAGFPGCIAFETEVAEVSEEDGEGDRLPVPGGRLGSDRYAFLLMAANGEAKGAEGIYVVSDDREDRLTAREYIQPALP